MTPQQREVLDAVKRLGGISYTYEIAQVLGLPSTTAKNRVRGMLLNGMLEDCEPPPEKKTGGPERRYFRIKKN